MGPLSVLVNQVPYANRSRVKDDVKELMEVVKSLLPKISTFGKDSEISEISICLLCYRMWLGLAFVYSYVICSIYVVRIVCSATPSLSVLAMYFRIFLKRVHYNFLLFSVTLTCYI